MTLQFFLELTTLQFTLHGAHVPSLESEEAPRNKLPRSI
jgi:hypothetical protein